MRSAIIETETIFSDILQLCVTIVEIKSNLFKSRKVSLIQSVHITTKLCIVLLKTNKNTTFLN